MANVAPVVTAAANQSSDEGEAHGFSLGSFTDPGVGWPVDRCSVDWGDSLAGDDFTTSSPGTLADADPHLR